MSTLRSYYTNRLECHLLPFSVMRGRFFLCLFLAALVPILLPTERGSANRLKTIKETYCPASVNDPFPTEQVIAVSKGAEALKSQIAPGLRHFSPGEIDDACGRNLRVAVIGFQRENPLALTGSVDQPKQPLLNQGAPGVLVQCPITPGELAGALIEVSEAELAVTTYDQTGALVSQYPATVGYFGMPPFRILKPELPPARTILWARCGSIYGSRITAFAARRSPLESSTRHVTRASG